MSPAERAALETALSTITPFAGLRPAQLRPRPLPGLSQRSYLLAPPGRRPCVLRLPAAGRAGLREPHHAALAARLGLAPALLWAGDDGVTLYQYLRPGQPLRPSELRRGRDARRALRTLRRLHDSGARFDGRREPLAEIDANLAAAAGLWRLRLRPLRARLGHSGGLSPTRRGRLRPCHIDPNPANFIRVAGGLRLIDWEYAARAEPYWDLAVVAVEAGADETAARQLLAWYHGRGVGDARGRRRFLAYRCAMALLAAAWAAARLNAGHGEVSAVYARERWRLSRRLTRRLQREAADVITRQTSGGGEKSSALHRVVAGSRTGKRTRRGRPRRR